MHLDQVVGGLFMERKNENTGVIGGSIGVVDARFSSLKEFLL